MGAVGMTSRAVIFFQRLIVVVLGSKRKWGQGFFFFAPSHSPLALQFIRPLCGTFSPEEKPWVGVCNFWWINTYLTHSSFFYPFNLDSMFFPIFHLLSFSECLSGLCSLPKTVVADLIGLCWTLALHRISYDHLGVLSAQISCED